MTSRKRKHSSTFISDDSRSPKTVRSSNKRTTQKKRRQNILERLEARQLLAGPQLLGIQPNQGDLIVNGSVLDTAPRVLTLRFDQDQQLNENTFDGIRLTRAGEDGILNTDDDVQITPGLITSGQPNENEVLIRFSETLTDDRYKLEVFGFDDPGLGIVGLRNQRGELFQPFDPDQRSQTTEFDLRLGTLIESIVPQPVVRTADGSLKQNRNEIVVYFNEDPLFVEDDAATGSIAIAGNEIAITGKLTSRSFDDTSITFDVDNLATATTAVHDATARTIVVSHPQTATFQDISDAIDALELFDANVAAGNPADTFNSQGMQFDVKGNPTERSAENPRFYSLLLTQDTVRTTDDALFQPEEVAYDPVSHTARLFFATDINELVPTTALNPVDASNPDDTKTRQQVPLGGGTFRLRIGTAIDRRIDVILPPVDQPVAPAATSDFGIEDLQVTFTSTAVGESASGGQVRFIRSNNPTVSAQLDTDPNNVVFDLGTGNPTFAELKTAAQNGPVNGVITVTIKGDPNETVPERVVGAPPLVLTAVGDTLGEALHVGTFGQDSELVSLVFQEAIDPKTFVIELPGSNDDPGHIEIPEIAGALLQHIGETFGPDSTNGVTEVAYNFKGIFDTDADGRDFLNQIKDRQKTRIREALGLWSSKIGVQFRETASEGITFALGDVNDLQDGAITGVEPVSQTELDARLRIDPTFQDSAIVFSNQVNYGLDYGEDFTRKAMAGIGLILGLETAPDLPIQTLMRLDPLFLNDTINHTDPLPPELDFLNILPAQASLRDLEPSFPGNFDILHGNYLHRSDSVDVDLYRFDVDLNDPNRVGTLTAETFAERLPNSSLLDTTLTLFQEQRASEVTDFGVGTTLSVRIDSMLEGRLGNNSRIDFIETDRSGGDRTVRVDQPRDLAGNLIANGLLIDLPRTGVVEVGDVIDAINDDPFASSIFHATLLKGSVNEDIGIANLSFSPLLLSGGGIVQLSRNDDYFSEDSRIITQLGAGTYYIGVAASGNDRYDPTIADSGYGGRTQGDYELHLKFEPQVDKGDVIRDVDNPREDVPGTPLDGDGDGVPGGVKNFWFQTRSLNRRLDFTDDGAAITPGQTVSVTGGGGMVRRYEFVPLAALGQTQGNARPGNTAVFYNAGLPGQNPDSAADLAGKLRDAINGENAGVDAQAVGSSVIFGKTNSGLDGQLERSVSVSSSFRGGEILGRNIFVDKTAGPQADGSMGRPFNNIANPAVANAFGVAREGDIVRIVGNGGADGDLTTTADNFAYQIGVADTGGQSLVDGRTMEVPMGVTTMIDAGAAFKLRNSRIGVGSSSVQLDRSNGALQVLGTPRLVELSLNGQPVRTTVVGDENSTANTGFSEGSVIFTSSRDRDVDTAAAGINPPASPGNWGGLVFRRDVDQAEGRRDLEDEGIFMQHVNHAEIRYGGTGNLLIDSVQQTVNPIQIINLRPNITFNSIAFSADAAISAAPNSFEETSFQSPIYQVNGSFTADYSRIGPDIHRNVLVDNSINALFIRSSTTPVSPASPVTTTVRFDDTSIVHAIAENVSVAGNPGGSINDGFSPTLGAVTGRSLPGGGLAAGTYQYRMTFVDSDGFESLSTTAADAFDITVATNNRSVQLIGLPAVNQSDYVARRLYRADTTAPGPLEFKLVRELDASTLSVIDDGTELGGRLDLNATGTRGRLNGSLVFDPNIVVKLQGSRIELGHGAQLLAEGTQRNPVVLTSSLDDRYGAGGTFDTNNDNNLVTSPAVPTQGDWSGIYGAPGSNISIDNAIFAFSGGISLIGAESKGFAPIELHQANARITNTSFESNDDGQDGSADTGREGRLGITPSTIFVRGAQPVIAGNSFIDNRGAIISIDHDSLIADYVQDTGRQTGASDRLSELDDNQGPLIRENRYQNVASFDPREQQLSGLDVRGGVITTETVMDDTDIVHVITDTLEVGNFHSSGGLLLKSRPEESLVVKFFGGRLQEQVHVGTAGGNANSPSYGTGLTATGSPGTIADRIGGTIHILGLPGARVVMTSLKDDTVGAGLSPTGTQFTDTNGDANGSRPEANDWRSILLDQWSNDRNVDMTLEQELSTAVAPGFNSTTENAQVLGELAKSLDEGDDTRRLGFEVAGYLSGPTDVDVFSFVGSPGTEVWVDIDKTSFQLDTVIELLDVSGNLLGRSDNSFAEIAGTEDLLNLDPQASNVGTLQSKADEFTEFDANGNYKDFNSTNPRDAGLRFTLPGSQSNVDSRSVYFFRVRSASVNPDDVAGGLTGGAYRFQLRLTEDQEFPGSVVRFTDIRYANNGIHVRGLPGESPLLGDAQENEGVADPPTLNGASPLAGVPLNDRVVTSTRTFSVLSPTGRFLRDELAPGQRPQNLGNLVDNKNNVISVGGRLELPQDIDFYQVDLEFGEDAELYQSTTFDIDYADGSRPDTNLSIFYDPDGPFGLESPRLVLFGQNSNIAEDRTSPFGADSALELLSNGSVGEGDAFVGPVSLPEGSYYVGVSEAGSIPFELIANSLVRREPINSVQRLFEERIDAAAPSTASGPRNATLFSSFGDFVLDDSEADVPGHGLPAAFDYSTETPQRQKTIYNETEVLEALADIGFVVPGGDIGNVASQDLAVSTAAFLSDLNSYPLPPFPLPPIPPVVDWSLADNTEIGGAFAFDPLIGEAIAENTSTLIPHISIDGNMGDVGDMYTLQVPDDGLGTPQRIIIDIDRGTHPFFFPDDPTNVDLELEIYSVDSVPGTTPVLIDGSSTSDARDGRVGSAPAIIPPTSDDPFIDTFLAPGFYAIAVMPEGNTVELDAGDLATLTRPSVTINGASGLATSQYRLHISAAGQEVTPDPEPQDLAPEPKPDPPLPPRPTNETLFLARNTVGFFNPGELTTDKFDLAGYSADDQPRFYFNYKLDTLDLVTVKVTSLQDPVGVELTDLIPDGQWRQSIIDLNQFAGHEDIEIEFEYARTLAPGGTGLHLDDFIIGFAERGETVFYARGDHDQFLRTDEGNAGEYQLEIRTSTDFATPIGGGDLPSQQQLDLDFDTNDRQAQQVTIVAPAGNQITDGDTFTISDGATTQRFEFDNDNQSNFENIPVSFDPNDSSIEIAEKLRAIINIAPQLDIEAASASGVDTGSMTDNRLNLFGAVNGSFNSVTSPATAPIGPLNANLSPEGDVLLPAIMHNGSGDSNYRRIQSQVIIENNVISDVNAIGIWSDPGDRDVDSEDLREDPRNWPNLVPWEQGPVDVPHPLLQQPPVGNVYPGAVRNLPTLNEEVIGGLAPGVVIRNNTVDQAGLAGIKVSGETRAFVLDDFDGTVVPDPLVHPPLSDGLAMAIDAGGTRVVFEFEDIGGAATTIGGSGIVGGDGFTDGHVPIYYGHRSTLFAYTSVQLAEAIRTSIEGSILVNNDMAELVTPYIGPSLNSRDEFSERFAPPFNFPSTFATAAVYLEGVSNIYYTDAYAKVPGFFRPRVSLAPVGEAVQPVARITNNTIYGADGIESAFPGDPTDETNDLIQDAVVTHVGRAHTGPFRATAAIGDIGTDGFITPENDVDFYQVELMVGDRLIVDIDTAANGPDTSVRVFDASGVAQIVTSINGNTSKVNTSGTAPSYLDPASTVNNPVNDANNARDPFVDFTAPGTGTYFIAVSGDGNEFDPNDLSGRVGGTGGVGTYDIGIETYHARQVVMSINGGRDTSGTTGADLLGTTFTVTQIPDVVYHPNSPFNGAQTNGNQITFQFGGGGGNIPVAIGAASQVPDIMRAIADAVNGIQNVAEAIDFPAIPNYELGTDGVEDNGLDGVTGPIHRGRALALGGDDGNNTTLNQQALNNSQTLINDVTGLYDTELYVLFQNIASIELSPAARAAGLTLSPDAAKPQFAQNSDQLIAEAGIWVTSGASPTVLNNAISNVHQSMLVEESNFLGFGKRVSVFGDEFIKQQEVFLTGTAFQHDEERNSEIRSDAHWQIETSLSTDEVIGATNVADDSDDFNFTLRNTDPLFVNAAGNNFLPNKSVLIDSAINSVDERDSMQVVKNAVGLPMSNVLASDRDVRGVLRQDNPNFVTPGALGFSVFKDRGSNELADFVGPFATTEVPRDNDAEGIDVDPATGFINLSRGTYEEFRIQLRDTGDESDPFAGFGVDDRTVVVPKIEGLRHTGANLTIFEDGRLLTEGIDYTFNYDSTKNIITLTPLAGIWKDDRSYRIALNNRDRTVMVAPDPSLVTDGDQIEITDNAGSTLVFEFEIGYSILTPEPISMVIPRVGTNAGGLRDGNIFKIDDGQNPVVLFEFDNDGIKLNNTVKVDLPAEQTPTVEADLRIFLDQIAQNLGDAIQSQIDIGNLDANIRVLKTQSTAGGRIAPEVVVGAEAGTILDSNLSGLIQKTRTLAFQIPAEGTGPGGIRDGDSFVIDNGVAAATFEFDTGNGLNNNTSIAVPIPGVLTGPDVAQVIVDTVRDAGLGLNPIVESGGQAVYLNLPLDGEARVNGGQLTLVGLSRPATDGDLVVVTPNDGSAAITLEINRTDEPSPNGPIDDGVTAPNTAININRSTTADELAGRIGNAIQAAGNIAGLDPNDLQVIDGGILSIGGEEGLGLNVTAGSLEVTGSPSVTAASTIEIFGPLLLTLSPVGGGTIDDGSVIAITDDNGDQVVFEFNENGTLSSGNGFNIVPYDTFSTADVIAANLVTAINAANTGITAQLTGSLGEISLGQVSENRIDLNGIRNPNNPFIFLPGLPSASLQRGIVGDGEIMTIRQGTITVSYEFEAAIGGGGVQPNNIAVPFEANSSIGDVAVALAATINNNLGGLQLTAVAETDANGDPTGIVSLNDQPGTEINVVLAPTLSVTGVPGGATPIRISADFGPEEVKQALIQSINSVNQPGQAPATTLFAEDRGGETFFVTNGVNFSGLVENFALPAITDLAGNVLEANRPDLSTQFTILMPTVGLDFGDAPDPRDEVSGRYPTTNRNNGPRHVVSEGLALGFFIDADADGIPGDEANGDDRVIEISSTGTLFTTSLVEDVEIEIVRDDETFVTVADLAAQIEVGTVTDPLLNDGDLIVIQTGTSQATLEFDSNFRFDENHFAIRPTDPTSPDSIAEAIGRAIAESPLTPASVSVDGNKVLINADDEDGVTFISDSNPTGVLNHGVSTPIEVSVSGSGILEAWIDFNADGDWDDPGEQIIPMPDNDTFDDLRSEICPTDLTGIASNIFAATGGASSREFCIVIPPTTPVPLEPVQTYARFRISREGGLGPTGLALSGEVEDYALTLRPGLPPQIEQPNLTYTVKEDFALTATDFDGNLTPGNNQDDGLLATVTDPDGDTVHIFPEDVGTKTLMSGDAVAGELRVFANGTFTFDPETDFNGLTDFSVRVTDGNLVNSRPISVTINVTPVNDRPKAVDPPVIIERTGGEDVDQTFDIDELIGDKFIPGPIDELDQPMFIQAAGFGNQAFQTQLGGSLTISENGESVTYTPPLNENGVVDTFTYVVADLTSDNPDSQTVDLNDPNQLGTVVITLNAVNDAPITGDDSYTASEDTPLQILVNGDPNDPNSVGILDNDLPGPPDEVAADQTIELSPQQFPKATLQGGNVTRDGNVLTYTPPALFSGDDSFVYLVRDNEGAESEGTVRITVLGVNNAPQFIGIDGDSNEKSIDRDEAKPNAETETYNLNTWFVDPEDDAMTFTVTTGDSDVVAVTRDAEMLTLTYPPFGFGETVLTVVATDSNGDASPTIEIPVRVSNTPDTPTVIGTLNPLNGTEDELVTADLTGIFFDPDGEALEYSVTRLDDLINPTAAEIAAHPLIERVEFINDQMQIILKPNQFGTVIMEVAATDGLFPPVTNAFTLTIAAVPDAPVARDDEYDVPIGSSLQVLNPLDGLLNNDSDADGDTFTVNVLTEPTLGTLIANPNGTFTYTNTGGSVGDVDSFTYELIDSTGLTSEESATVTLNIIRSRYQNPAFGLEADVTGDGLVTPIDALRVLNFIDRRGGEVSVSNIGAPPPDFLDPNGDGTVSAADALFVINRLRSSSPAGEGEMMGPAASAVTTGFVSSGSINLPSRNLEITPEPINGDESRDLVLATGMEISAASNQASVDWVVSGDQAGTTNDDDVDAALSQILGDEDFDGMLS
ncbi:MAG: tandem-95 repeat protein [Rubripirellula sp.]|nr:tandem-95 repeat protein [Rubripirellula sp.]